jgi:hypothetical protein
MAKNTVQDWDGEVASNNADVGGINISEQCPPGNVNDALREIMRQVKAWQSGVSGVDLIANGEATFNGNVNLNSTLTVGNGEGTNGQFLKSLGAGQPPVWDTFKTMATQDANAVAITGGTIVDTTVNGHVIGSNGQGNKIVSTSDSPTGGNDGDIWYTLK